MWKVFYSWNFTEAIDKCNLIIQFTYFMPFPEETSLSLQATSECQDTHKSQNECDHCFFINP